MGSGGEFEAGLNGNRGRGVPRPCVCLAGGGGAVWGVDDGALRDGDVDKGLDGVVLGGRLCGGGSRLGEGDSGFGGWGVLACVWVRVWVRAGSLLLPSYLLWFLGLCGVVLVMFFGGGGGAAAAAGDVVVWVPVLICGRVLGCGPVRG